MKDTEKDIRGRPGRALVTGATGFVGAAVARRLLERGFDVRALVRPESPVKNLDGLDVETAVGDVRDKESVKNAARGCAVVFHVAADYRLWVPDPAEMYRSNVEGTVNVMEAALGADSERVVYTSSVATIRPSADGAPANEDTRTTVDDMVGHYKRSKFLAEEKVRAFVKREGLPVAIVCPSTPVGPRDVKPTPTGRVIVDAASGKMPAFVDTGLNLVHVDDVAEGHLLALERGEPGERYILGASDMTLCEILNLVASITGNPPPKVCLPHGVAAGVAVVSEAWARATGGEPRVTRDGVKMSRRKMYFSSDKARRLLGYAPGPAEKALEEAVEWFRRNGYL